MRTLLPPPPPLADCYETIPKSLIQLAKEGSSSDNITIIVVYLKDPSEIAKFSWPSADTTQPLDNMETTTTTTTTDPMSITNTTANENNPFGSYNNFESSNQVGSDSLLFLNNPRLLV